METLTVAVLPDLYRASVESHLPADVEALWWTDGKELMALAPRAEIGWFDMHSKTAPLAAIAAARELRWLCSTYAGVDWMPLDELARRGVTLSCGSGLTSSQVAEYALMTMLAVVKGFPELVRAQDRHEWLKGAAGERDLAGSHALLLGGTGAIGRAIRRRLGAFEVACEAVGSADIGWRGRLGQYDWIVTTLPETPQTAGLFGANEIAAMASHAVLVNFGRAATIDQDALVAALAERRIGGAILDLTDPEPLPPGHPLWDLPNTIITMHLAGLPTAASRARAAGRFLENLALWRAGKSLVAQVDLERGY